MSFSTSRYRAGGVPPHHFFKALFSVNIIHCVVDIKLAGGIVQTCDPVLHLQGVVIDYHELSVIIP